MIPCQPINRKTLALFSVLFIFSFLKASAQGADAANGEKIFQTKCATCHSVTQDGTGPALKGLESRGQWKDHDVLLKWVHNPAKFMETDPYTKGLFTQRKVLMTSFSELSRKDVDDIVSYVNNFGADATPSGGPVNNAPPDNTNWVIFGIITLIMAIVALILMQVNSNLKKLSDDNEGILRPDPVPFYRNKSYIALVSIIVFIAIGFYLTQGGIGLNRQKNFEPVQPIFYSHKVHAGINQISCLYCHGNAWESKHAAIPSTNVCMNCHKNIKEYKGAKLYDGDGNEVNGTEQIKKLYRYAGFDPTNANAWNPSMAKGIPWEKIHNLPDHVYFNHSQHVRAGKVQCQTCHGSITEMDEVKQFAELSMGWCINCHRQTAVNFNYTDSTGNKFYSIYEKFHKDIQNHKMDSVRVKDIGGLECQKCHY